MTILILTSVLILFTFTTAVTVSSNSQNISLSTTSRPSWVQTYGQEGCSHANSARSAHGLHPLYYSAALTDLAAQHSNWMASYDIFEHQNLYGLGVWIGSEYLPVSAENIAMSVPRSYSPASDAHEQWYHSPGHFANMMGHHTHCGVGIAYDAYGRWWATQLFGNNYNLGDQHGSHSQSHAPQPIEQSHFHSQPVSAPAPAPAHVAAPAPAPAGISAPGALGTRKSSPSTPRESSPSSSRGSGDTTTKNPLLNGEQPTTQLPSGMPTEMIGNPLST